MDGTLLTGWNPTDWVQFPVIIMDCYPMLIPYKFSLKDEACLRYKQKFDAAIKWPNI